MHKADPPVLLSHEYAYRECGQFKGWARVLNLLGKRFVAVAARHADGSGTDVGHREPRRIAVDVKQPAGVIADNLKPQFEARRAGACCKQPSKERHIGSKEALQSRLFDAARGNGDAQVSMSILGVGTKAKPGDVIELEAIQRNRDVRRRLALPEGERAVRPAPCLEHC